jgi:tRNA G37 N-methylase Trm5/tRNA(Phe) wybutosine-synthesizing methylase Tyw3
MKTSFAREKAGLLDRLLAGCDNSPKGTIDAPILPLVELLNGDPRFVTTSTCSGRISIFAPPSSSTVSASGGHGKGGSGRWLMSSHTPVARGAIRSAIEDGVAAGAVSDAVLKHEPAILHVRCVDLRWAEWLLKIALAAGFRESGIVPGKTKLMVAIRTTSTVLEVPLVFLGRQLYPNTAADGPDASATAGDQDYYRALESVANHRFHLNQTRLQRLENAVRDALRDNSIPSSDGMPEIRLQGSLDSLAGAEQKQRRRGTRRNERRRQASSTRPNDAEIGYLSGIGSTEVGRWGAGVAVLTQPAGTGVAGPRDFSLLLFGGYGPWGGRSRSDSERFCGRKGDTVLMQWSSQASLPTPVVNCQVASQSAVDGREFCAIASFLQLQCLASRSMLNKAHRATLAVESTAAGGCAFCAARSCPLTVRCDIDDESYPVTESGGTCQRAYCSRYCLAAHRKCRTALLRGSDLREDSRNTAEYSPAFVDPLTSHPPLAVLFGGRQSPHEALSDAWCWNNDACKWEEIPGTDEASICLDQWPAPRWGHTLTAVLPSTPRTTDPSKTSCCFLLLGGRDSDGAINDSDCAFLLVAGSGEGTKRTMKWHWKRIPSNVGPIGFHHTATVISSSLPSSSSTVVAVFGGWQDVNNCHPCSRLMVLDVSHASVRLRRTLNVVGARIGDGSTGLRVEAARRGGHAALTVGHFLCVLGGAGDGLETPQESLEEEKDFAGNAAHVVGPAFLLPVTRLLGPAGLDESNQTALLEGVHWEPCTNGSNDPHWYDWGDSFIHGIAVQIPSSMNTKPSISECESSETHDVLLLGGGLPCFAFGPIFVPAMVIRLRWSGGKNGAIRHLATSTTLRFNDKARYEERQPSLTVVDNEDLSHVQQNKFYTGGVEHALDGPSVEGQIAVQRLAESESVECVLVPSKCAKCVKNALEASGYLNKAFRMAPARAIGARSPAPNLAPSVAGKRKSEGKADAAKDSELHLLAVPLTKEGVAAVDGILSNLSFKDRPDKSDLAAALFEAVQYFSGTGHGVEYQAPLDPSSSGEMRSLPRQSCELPASKVRLTGQRAKLENAVLDLLTKFCSDRKQSPNVPRGNEARTASLDQKVLLASVRASSLLDRSAFSGGRTPSLTSPQSSSRELKSGALEKVGQEALLLAESTLCHSELCAPPFDVLLDGGSGEGIGSGSPSALVNSSRGVQELWAVLAACFGCRLVCRAAHVDAGPKRQSRVRILYVRNSFNVSGASSASKQKSKAQKCDGKISGKEGVDANGLSLSCGPFSAGWVSVKENGLFFSFDITRVMFCSGNVTERTRMAAPPVHEKGSAEEVIVDLYAGIGYYSLPFLVHHNRTKHVHCCEWNPDSLVALRFNLEENGVDPSRYSVHAGDNRITMGFSVPSDASDIVGGSGVGSSAPLESRRGAQSTHPSDNTHAVVKTARSSLRGIADRVNLGLIPSSEEGWPLAVAALRSKGGWVHVHDNVKDCDIIAWAEALCSAFEALGEAEWGSIASWGGWAVQCIHIERVKSYAPHVLHVVADLWIQEKEKL